MSDDKFNLSSLSHTDQEWLQKPSGDVHISKKNIDWVDDLFKAADVESRFFKDKEHFYLLGFTVALVQKREPEIWRGRTGEERMISKIVRGWDSDKGDEARDLLRQVFGTKPLENGMDPSLIPNKCISSLVDQGLDIIHEKHIDSCHSEQAVYKYTWTGIALLLSSGILFQDNVSKD